MYRFILAALLGLFLNQASDAQTTAPDKDGWFSLFDGKSLDGWKAGE